MGCEFKEGDVITLPNDEIVERILNRECTLSQGVRFRLYYEHEDSNNKEVLQKTKEKKAMPEVEETALEEVSVPEPKKEVQATTSVPDAPFDLNQVIQSTNSGGAGVAIILALIAVAGGGAAWKFYKQFSEQKHEQAMKKLELEAQANGMKGVQPPPCQAQNVIIEGRLAAMEAKLATVEKKSSSISADFDAEELEERVLKLEKKVKTLSAKSV